MIDALRRAGAKVIAFDVLFMGLAVAPNAVLSRDLRFRVRRSTPERTRSGYRDHGSM